MVKKIIMTVFLLLLITAFIYPQSSSQEKFSTVNIMLKRINFTNLGLIIEYFSGGIVREAYLPHKLFNEGIAVKVVDEDSRTTPQMNIIYKNGEQFKVKIYLPTYPLGPDYPLKDYLTQDIIDKFKNTDKLNIVLFDQAGTQTK